MQFVDQIHDLLERGSASDAEIGLNSSTASQTFHRGVVLLKGVESIRVQSRMRVASNLVEIRRDRESERLIWMKLGCRQDYRSIKGDNAQEKERQRIGSRHPAWERGERGWRGWWGWRGWRDRMRSGYDTKPSVCTALTKHMVHR